MLCEAPELWEFVTYFMLWRLQICSVKRPNYGKRSLFRALQAADMLCEAPELWKTYHISCFGDCRYALWNARTIENVTYFMLWRPQKCSAKRPNYGKLKICYALYHFNTTKSIKGPNQYAFHSFCSRQGRLFKNILMFYRISPPQIIHFKPRIKTSAPYLSGGPLTNSFWLCKKHFPPRVNV